MKGGHALAGPVEDVHQHGVGHAEALVNGALAHFYGRDVHAVKFFRIALEGFVALGPDLGDDFPDRLLYGADGVFAGEDGLALGLRFLQNADHFCSASLTATWVLSPS